MKKRGATRIRLLYSIGVLVLGFKLAAPISVCGQVSPGPESPPARLGVLLDTSAEMGFIVPQVRKEIRFLNNELEQMGRFQVEYREIIGAALDRENSLAVPARRNVLYALKELYEQSGCDSVYWITALRGIPNDRGLFSVEQMLEDRTEDRLKRKLIIRNIWQDQIQAGDEWVYRPPEPDLDPLDLRSRPDDWYRLIAEGRGLIIRSWQRPLEEFREQFGFPHRIRNTTYLRLLGQNAREAFFDQEWARELAGRHRLKFNRPKEEWLPRLTGRRWLSQASLLPFVNEETLEHRSESVFRDLSVRETIEEDISRIDATNIGVLFGFGYLKTDLDRLRRTQGNPGLNWRSQYVADLTRIVAETRKNQHDFEKRRDRAGIPERVYASELVEPLKMNRRPEGIDPYAARTAKLVREEGVDAIYFFTNGYVGGGDYGTWGIDNHLLSLAIRDAGIPLYLRVPFEFGPIPISLQRIALASGGGLFLGTANDEDWNSEIPSAAWPEPPAEDSSP